MGNMEGNIAVINSYLDSIVYYYQQLRGVDSLIAFLKRECQCIDDCLALIDLTLLPISQECINEFIHVQRENLQQQHFLTESRKLSSQLVNVIFDNKHYAQMSKPEQAIYDAFICFFPIEIESSDLLIESFVDKVLDCGVSEEQLLTVLAKHFNDII